MAWDHTQAEVDVRTILAANLTPSLIAFWDNTQFKPPQPDGTTGVKWYDCDWRPQGKLIEESSQQITFGGSRAQTYLLEVGICFDAKARGAGQAALAEAELLEGYFTSADTSTMIYRVTEAYCEDSQLFDGVWHLLPWILRIDRYEG